MSCSWRSLRPTVRPSWQFAGVRGGTDGTEYRVLRTELILTSLEYRDQNTRRGPIDRSSFCVSLTEHSTRLVLLFLNFTPRVLRAMSRFKSKNPSRDPKSKAGLCGGG